MQCRGGGSSGTTEMSGLSLGQEIVSKSPPPPPQKACYLNNEPNLFPGILEEKGLPNQSMGPLRVTKQ